MRALAVLLVLAATPAGGAPAGAPPAPARGAPATAPPAQATAPAAPASAPPAQATAPAAPASAPPAHPPLPAPQSVRAALVGTTALLTVRFELPVAGPVLDTTTIELPARAVVIGAVATVDGVRHALALEPAGVAGAAFDRIERTAPGLDRSWAILISYMGSEVLVDLAAPRPARVELELSIAVATCFHRDARYAELPASWGPAVALARPAPPDGELAKACGASLDRRAWLGFPAPALAAGSPGEGRIGTSAARLPGSTQDVLAVELDVAGQLGAVPDDLATAIVVDASRSMSARERAVQRALVAAYLRATPHGRVQVIAFARRPRALLPRWTPAGEAAPQVDRALRALAPANGSNLDRALGEAARWLARTAGTRRIVVFGDERLPQRLLDAGPAGLRDLLPAHVLLHAVRVNDQPGALARDDDAVLAPLAAATEGIAVTGRVPAHGLADATLLARPLSLDHVSLALPGWTTLPGARCALDDDQALAEGAQCTWWAVGGPSAGAPIVEGRVWNHRFARVVQPDATHRLALARELAATTPGLDPAAQAEADQLARAVDGDFSLYASWGGRAGYAGAKLAGRFATGHVTGGICGGSICGGSIVDVIDTTSAYPARALHDQLAPAVARCRPGAARVEVTVETTREEIVAVEVAIHGRRSQRAAHALRACVTEGVWGTPLALPDPPERGSATVTFGQP